MSTQQEEGSESPRLNSDRHFETATIVEFAPDCDEGKGTGDRPRRSQRRSSGGWSPRFSGLSISGSPHSKSKRRLSCSPSDPTAQRLLSVISNHPQERSQLVDSLLAPNISNRSAGSSKALLVWKVRAISAICEYKRFNGDGKQKQEMSAKITKVFFQSESPYFVDIELRGNCTSPRTARKSVSQVESSFASPPSILFWRKGSEVCVDDYNNIILELLEDLVKDEDVIEFLQLLNVESFLDLNE